MRMQSNLRENIYKTICHCGVISKPAIRLLNGSAEHKSRTIHKMLEEGTIEEFYVKYYIWTNTSYKGKSRRKKRIKQEKAYRFVSNTELFHKELSKYLSEDEMNHIPKTRLETVSMKNHFGERKLRLSEIFVYLQRYQKSCGLEPGEVSFLSALELKRDSSVNLGARRSRAVGALSIKKQIFLLYEYLEKDYKNMPISAELYLLERAKDIMGCSDECVRRILFVSSYEAISAIVEKKWELTVNGTLLKRGTLIEDPFEKSYVVAIDEMGFLGLSIFFHEGYEEFCDSYVERLNVADDKIHYQLFTCELKQIAELQKKFEEMILLGKFEQDRYVIHCMDYAKKAIQILFEGIEVVSHEYEELIQQYEFERSMEDMVLF